MCEGGLRDAWTRFVAGIPSCQAMCVYPLGLNVSFRPFNVGRVVVFMTLLAGLGAGRGRISGRAGRQVRGVSTVTSTHLRRCMPDNRVV